MRNQKGITLIALVITIIVLLILAGVTIAMLTGDNGLLNRASEAKYDNVLASVDENARLAQLSLKTTITSNMVSKSGYIATGSNTTKYPATSNDTVFGALVKEVAKGLAVTYDEVQTEKYSVVGYVDTKGTDAVDGTGYIYIAYSDNALRSSLPAEALTSPWSSNGVSYSTTGLANTNAKLNQATVVYAIKVENYDCSLCTNAVITTNTNVTADFAATAYSSTSVNGQLTF